MTTTPKNRRNLALIPVLATLLSLLAAAVAHQSVVVGEGAYRVTVGLLNAPYYVGQIESLDLIIRDSGDQLIEGLEGSLIAEIIAPNGAKLSLSVWPQSGKPGYYTADFIPTVAGNYRIRVIGFIGEVSFDETFEHYAHADPIIQDPAAIRVP